MWVSVSLSVLAVVAAVILNDPTIGQRGGALGVALSFAILFLGKSTPQRALTSRTAQVDNLGGQETQQPSDDDAQASENLQSQITELQETQDNVIGALSAMLDWSQEEKVYLTISSVFSTIFWGFGDCFAGWFIT